jgi:hypothetical protein
LTAGAEIVKELQRERGHSPGAEKTEREAKEQFGFHGGYVRLKSGSVTNLQALPESTSIPISN